MKIRVYTCVYGYGSDITNLYFLNDQNYYINLDLKTFEYSSDTSYSNIPNFFTLTDIPLPNKNCLKKSYEIGDKVYFQGLIHHMLNVGKITRKEENMYFIGCYKYGTSNEFIPYKWYILHKNCRNAIREWLLISRRLCIYKDVRKLIASYIWELRNEYEWNLKHKSHKKLKSDGK